MPIANSFAERRQFGRRKTFLQGSLLIEGRSKLECVVRNVSEGGAFLECVVPKVLPFHFKLVIAAKRFEAVCEVRHQTEAWMGVRFVRFDQIDEPIASWSLDVIDAWTGRK